MYEQDNWKNRSRGFVQDWAEGEPDDDDETKNNPFPFPQIRDIPDELNNSTDVDTSNQTISISNPMDQNSIDSQNLEDSTVKSTEKKPSVANQKDVARARAILHYRNSLLRE